MLSAQEGALKQACKRYGPYESLCACYEVLHCCHRDNATAVPSTAASTSGQQVAVVDSYIQARCFACREPQHAQHVDQDAITLPPLSAFSHTHIPSGYPNVPTHSIRLQWVSWSQAWCPCQGMDAATCDTERRARKNGALHKDPNEHSFLRQVAPQAATSMLPASSTRLWKVGSGRCFVPLPTKGSSGKLGHQPPCTSPASPL